MKRIYGLRKYNIIDHCQLRSVIFFFFFIHFWFVCHLHRHDHQHLAVICCCFVWFVPYGYNRSPFIMIGLIAIVQMMSFVASYFIVVFFFFLRSRTRPSRSFHCISVAIHTFKQIFFK